MAAGSGGLVEWGGAGLKAAVLRADNSSHPKLRVVDTENMYTLPTRNSYLN